MTGADKVVCQAATLLVLFTLTSVPAKAQFQGLGGGAGDASAAMMRVPTGALESVRWVRRYSVGEHAAAPIPVLRPGGPARRNRLATG